MTSLVWAYDVPTVAFCQDAGNITLHSGQLRLMWPLLWGTKKIHRIRALRECSLTELQIVTAFDKHKTFIVDDVRTGSQLVIGLHAFVSCYRENAFCAGVRDRVKCFYCNGGLQNWRQNDDPWHEHAKWYPTCEFLLQQRGPEFIHNIVARFPNLNRPLPHAAGRDVPPRPRYVCIKLC